METYVKYTRAMIKKGQMYPLNPIYPRKDVNQWVQQVRSHPALVCVRW